MILTKTVCANNVFYLFKNYSGLLVDVDKNTITNYDEFGKASIIDNKKITNIQQELINEAKRDCKAFNKACY